MPDLPEPGSRSSPLPRDSPPFVPRRLQVAEYGLTRLHARASPLMTLAGFVDRFARLTGAMLCLLLRRQRSLRTSTLSLGQTSLHCIFRADLPAHTRLKLGLLIQL